jgi:DNA-binding NarL/FixJ family response regulator
MKKILIVDSTPYSNELSEQLKMHECEICSTAFDAVSLLNARGYDLVISKVELPGDNSFEFYYYMDTHFPYIPIIMMTEKDLDEYFEEILKNGIGNVLTIPVDIEELKSLMSKLLHESPIFGLNNYVKDILSHKKIELKSSLQINNAIKTMTDMIQQDWKFEIQNIMMINLIMNEMLINAIYHAHGYTNYKLSRTPIKLPEGKHVDLTFCHNSEEYAICVSDYMGTLTSKRILESIYTVIFQKKLMEQAFETGSGDAIKIAESGRGLELIRKLAKEYYFIIHRDKRTDVILKFDSSYTFDTKKSAAVKIIERI